MRGGTASPCRAFAPLFADALILGSLRQRWSPSGRAGGRRGGGGQEILPPPRRGVPRCCWKASDSERGAEGEEEKQGGKRRGGEADCRQRMALSGEEAMNDLRCLFIYLF